MPCSYFPGNCKRKYVRLCCLLKKDKNFQWKRIWFLKKHAFITYLKNVFVFLVLDLCSIKVPFTLANVAICDYPWDNQWRAIRIRASGKLPWKQWEPENAHSYLQPFTYNHSDMFGSSLVTTFLFHISAVSPSDIVKKEVASRIILPDFMVLSQFVIISGSD